MHQYFLRTIIQQKATERSYIKKRATMMLVTSDGDEQSLIKIDINIQSSTSLCRQHHCN